MGLEDLVDGEEGNGKGGEDGGFGNVGLWLGWMKGGEGGRGWCWMRKGVWGIGMRRLLLWMLGLGRVFND